MEVNVDSVTELFDKHYEEKSNERILFSGRFGSGKTYFLKKYFVDKEASTFWITPVNYSVSSNENIFEYIKFDLIIKLLSCFDAIKNEKPQFSNSLLAQQYLIYHPIEAINQLAGLLTNFSEKAKLISEVLSKILEINENFRKHVISHNKKTDKDQAIDFLTVFANIKGSIYEDDIITQIIREGINILKKQSDNKVILIVDDIDRLDPEHIFRILNIFSIHNDYYSSSNKFDFDKILLVCDYDNIQKIFEHRYGIDVDFEGYIDKFYTNDVFRFNNELALIFFCDTFIADLLKDKDSVVFLKILLKELVTQKKITVRNIIKSKYYIENMDKDFFEPFEVVRHTIDITNPYPDQYVRYDTGFKGLFTIPSKANLFIHSSDISILKLIKILSIMCGDFNRLKYFTKELINNNSNDYDFSLENNTSMMKCFFLIEKIISNYDDPNNIYFSTDSQGISRYLINPNVDLFSHKFEIGLMWSPSDKYNGNISFFKDAKLIMDNDSIKFLKTKMKLSAIFKKFNEILIFLEKSNLHNRLGMTGN